MAIFRSGLELEKLANNLDKNDPIYHQLLDAITLEALVVYEVPCFSCGVKLKYNERSFVWPMPGDEEYLVMDLRCFLKFVEAGKRFIAEMGGDF